MVQESKLPSPTLLIRVCIHGMLCIPLLTRQHLMKHRGRCVRESPVLPLAGNIKDKMCLQNAIWVKSCLVSSLTRLSLLSSAEWIFQVIQKAESEARLWQHPQNSPQKCPSIPFPPELCFRSGRSCCCHKITSHTSTRLALCSSSWLQAEPKAGEEKKEVMVILLQKSESCFPARKLSVPAHPWLSCLTFRETEKTALSNFPFRSVDTELHSVPYTMKFQSYKQSKNCITFHLPCKSTHINFLSQETKQTWQSQGSQKPEWLLQCDNTILTEFIGWNRSGKEAELQQEDFCNNTQASRELSSAHLFQIFLAAVILLKPLICKVSTCKHNKPGKLTTSWPLKSSGSPCSQTALPFLCMLYKMKCTFKSICYFGQNKQNIGWLQRQTQNQWSKTIVRLGVQQETIMFALPQGSLHEHNSSPSTPLIGSASLLPVQKQGQPITMH